MNEPCPLRDSVLACEGHALVIGGPGSGKTTIALRKAVKRIQQGMTPGQSALFLSFSRAAVTRILDAAKRPVAVAVSGIPESTGLAEALRGSDEGLLSALGERGIGRTWPLRVGGSQYRVKAKQIRFGNDPTRSTAYLAVALPTTVADDARRTTTTLITVWSIVAVAFLAGLNWYIARRVSGLWQDCRRVSARSRMEISRPKSLSVARMRSHSLPMTSTS